jgi:hypothetical protein
VEQELVVELAWERVVELVLGMDHMIAYILARSNAHNIRMHYSNHFQLQL